MDENISDVQQNNHKIHTAKLGPKKKKKKLREEIERRDRS
jgi:hypothetical protein